MKKRSSHSQKNSQNANPKQMVDKYLSLAKSAASTGDNVLAESYYQYADHYHRVSNEARVKNFKTSAQEEVAAA